MKQPLILIAAFAFSILACKTNAVRNQNNATMTTDLEITTKETIKAIETFNAAVNKHDLNAVMNALTDDCVFENTNPSPDGTRYVGATAVRGFWEKFFTSNPDALFETEEMIATGDRCVVRWIYRKTRDGKPWHLRGIDVFKVRGGKVAEKLAYVKG